MPENSEPKNRNRIGAWIVALVIGLPILYSLSIGPVLFILQKTNGFGFGPERCMELVEIFYLPLIWLDERTILKTPLEFYLQLWGIK